MDTSFSLLTVSEIVDALPHGTFSNSEQRSRRKLGEAIRLLPTQYVQILTNLATANSQRKSSASEGNNLFLANPSLYHCIRSLSIKDIVDALPPATFSSRERRSRALLEDALVGLSDIDQNTLFAVAANKKRKREDLVNDSVDCRMRKKVKLTNVFPSIVSEECRRLRIAKFIDATGSNALARSVCGVCAGSFFTSEVREVSVAHLQEKNVLRPFRKHPAHVLTSGMLLHRTPDALHTASNGVLSVIVCDSCMRLLQHNKTPPLSLANGTWIGDVPSELSVLTLPRLNMLPTNGIPLEISDVARRSENINMLIEESASYVPDDIPDDAGIYFVVTVSVYC